MSDKKNYPIDQTVDHVVQSSVDTSRVDGGAGETVDAPPDRGQSLSREIPDIGGKLGKYTISKLLGKGGMGAVFLAHDPTLDRKVAVKIPFLNAGNADEVLHRFQREARAVAALQHPNICPVHEVTEDRGIHFMVMAFIEGRPLSDYLKKAKRFKVTSAINLVRKLALTLDDAHRKGVIHRDLKPANIMIDARNEPQIMDFGLARLDNIEASQLTAMGQILGTPAYMPPEQVSGNIDATGPPSDIYSLGVMLYEMLTGQLPLSGDMMSLMFKIANEIPAPASTHRDGIPEWLDKVCAIAMAKKPDERFASMKAFADALQGEAATREIESTLPIGAVAASAVPAASFPQLTIDTSPTRKPQVALRSGRGRNKKRNWLIAAAALPLFLLAGGWIIKITNPDGTEQTIRAAAGAKIEITAANDKKARVNPKPRTSLVMSKWPDGAPSLAVAPFDAGQAAQYQAAWAKYLGVPPVFHNSIGITFRLIPPGQFMMGSGDAEFKKVTSEESDVNFLRGFRSESPRHRVVLSQPFYLAVNEVARESYTDVMEEAEKPSSDEQQLPVGGVDFHEAIEFCERLSKRELLVAPAREGTQLVNLGGNTNGYRLPTEAEWEYACRAGTETMFHNGDTPESCNEVGWIDSNSENQPHPIANRLPNAYGIYDMHGSLWEWVEDHWNPITYQSYQSKPAIDPLPVTDAGFGRLVRGGNWRYSYRAARSAARRDLPENSWYEDLGFRVVLPVEAVKTRMLYAKSPARAAAMAILSKKGRVDIKWPDGDRGVSQLSDLPNHDFDITKVWLDSEYPNDDCVRLLRGMTTIERFEMGGHTNPLSVEAFDDINTLINLESLFLVDCRYLDDERISKLTDLHNLLEGDFWENQLTDVGLASFSSFPKLRRLQLGKGKNYTGIGFSNVASMPSLVELCLAHSSLNDDGVKALECFPNLQKLEIYDVELTSTGIGCLPEFNRLTYLDIGRNSAVGEQAIHSLSRFPSLRELDFDCTNITEATRIELTSLNNLKSLDIRDSVVQPKAVDRLQDALPNCEILTNAEPTDGWPAGLRFDGDDFVRTNLRYDGTMPITIEATVMMAEFSGTIIGSFEYSGIGLEHNDKFWAFACRDRGHYETVMSKETSKLRRLVRLSGVFDKTLLTMFVDGKLQSKGQLGQFEASEFPFLIGADPDSSGEPQNHFNGVIQSVRISNVVRYTSDYDAPVKYTADDSTLLLLDFTRPVSELAKDMSKYNVPCEIVGATPVRRD